MPRGGAGLRRRDSYASSRFPLVTAQSTQVFWPCSLFSGSATPEAGGSGCYDQQGPQQARKGWFQLVVGLGIWDLVPYSHSRASSALATLGEAAALAAALRLGITRSGLPSPDAV